MEAVVAAEEVRKAYGETVALAGVSLSVASGEVFALIGPNGAGKTTLVRALTGTTGLDRGSAEVLGETPADADRDRLGVLPQDFSPPARLTARELLEYYAGLYAETRDPGRVLADVGLADAADTWYENLSGGQQRRVCVGSALVNDPDVLFLDEPTTGIDPAGRRTVWRLIEELAAGGTTVFLTTHDMVEAERLADRVGLLAGGELVATGAPDALVAEHGGSSRLTVETESGPDAFADLEYPVEAREGRVVVRGVSPAEIGAVVAALEERGVDYAGLSWSEPDLEDVYLALADETEPIGTDRERGALTRTTSRASATTESATEGGRATGAESAARAETAVDTETETATETETETVTETETATKSDAETEPTRGGEEP